MAFDQRHMGKLIWGVLLIAMGLLLCVKTPPALRAYPDSAFLNFARYFIALMLIVAGAKRLHKLYSLKDKEPPTDR
jgi:uncharacterized membrane protein HdeD (DUF308 family)